MRRFSVLFALCGWPALPLMMLGLPAPAVAQPSASPAVEFHGYGHVALERQSETPQADTETEHDLSLLATAAFTDRLRGWVQIAHLSETGRLRLDWAFVDWTLTPSTSLHVGQARLPLGLGNEVRDVQALRNSASLPLLYDDDLGLADEALRGAMVTTRWDHTAWGDFSLDAWGAGQMVPDAGAARTGPVVGGRLEWTPLQSPWTFKLSGYLGRQDPADDEDDVGGPPAGEPDGGRQDKRAGVISAHGDFSPWTVSAEWGAGVLNGQQLDIGYAAIDRDIDGFGGVFARLDTASIHELAGGEAPRRRHRLGLGVAWKPSPQWGARAEWARNHGNLEESDQPLRPRWNEVTVSLNFMF